MKKYSFIFILLFCKFLYSLELPSEIIDSQRKHSVCSFEKTVDKTKDRRSGFSVLSEPCNDCPNLEKRFLITPKGVKSMTMPDSYRALNGVSFYKDKTLITIDSQYGQLVIISDSENFKIIDSLLCFSFKDTIPLQSPSGRYLLFKKFYPRSCPESMTSNFVMIYDLEKSPLENRYHSSKIPTNDITIDNSYVGKYFFPENKDFEYSVYDPYNTEVEDKESYLYISGIGWETPRTILNLKYPKIKKNNFLLVEEVNDVVEKKVLKFKNFKIYDKNGNEIKYDQNLENNFQMKKFEFIENDLIIYNSADKSKVFKIIYNITANICIASQQNIYSERIEKEIVVLEKKLNLNLLSLIENKKFDTLQNTFIPYIALYSNIENKEKRLSLLFLMDKINFIIKTKYIRDEYFNSDNPLSSINMLPEKIDGQGGVMSGMSPDSSSLTKLEQEAYKNKLKLREEYLKEENIHLAAKSFYKTCLYFFNKYISLELEKNNLTKEELKNLFSYDSNSKKNNSKVKH